MYRKYCVDMHDIYTHLVQKYLPKATCSVTEQKLWLDTILSYIKHYFETWLSYFTNSPILSRAGTDKPVGLPHIQCKVGATCSTTQSSNSPTRITWLLAAAVPFGVLRAVPAKHLTQLWSALVRQTRPGVRIWPMCQSPVPFHPRVSLPTSPPTPPLQYILPSPSPIPHVCWIWPVQTYLPGTEQRLDLASTRPHTGPNDSWIDANVPYSTFATVLAQYWVGTRDLCWLRNALGLQCYESTLYLAAKYHLC